MKQLFNKIKSSLLVLESKDMKWVNRFNSELERKYSDFKVMNGVDVPFRYWFDNHYNHQEIINNVNELNGNTL